MKQTGITFRKIIQKEDGTRCNPSKRNLKKQCITLHKKLKKGDASVATEFVIERDDHRRKYHAHMIVYHSNEAILYSRLQHFVDGEEWKTRIEDIGKIKYCNGRYGEVDTFQIYNATEFRNYMNKTELSRTLI